MLLLQILLREFQLFFGLCKIPLKPFDLARSPILQLHVSLLKFIVLTDKCFLVVIALNYFHEPVHNRDLTILLTNFEA